MKTNYWLTDAKVAEMAEAVLATLEVSPINFSRKCEIARDYAVDEFGVRPSKSAVLLAVKLANLGWSGIQAHVKREVA